MQGLLLLLVVEMSVTQAVVEAVRRREIEAVTEHALELGLGQRTAADGGLPVPTPDGGQQVRDCHRVERVSRDGEAHQLKLRRLPTVPRAQGGHARSAIRRPERTP